MTPTGPPADGPSAADPLASPPARCPECGYALAGLPTAGRCPECGWAYDAETIVLYGRHATEPGDRELSMGAAAVITALLVAGLVTAGVALASAGRYWPALLVGGFGALLAAGVWHRNRQEATRSIQLRLCATGYAQRRGFGRARLSPWLAGESVEVEFADPGRPWRPPASPFAPFAPPRRGPSGRVRLGSGRRINFRFDADWPTVDRLARRVLAWREVAERG